MSDLHAIVRAAEALRARFEPFLLATVVRIEGSAYRRPGARMIVTPEGRITGSVSGGCLERDVAAKGFWRMTDDRAVVMTYDSTNEDEIGWGFGLGCNGKVELLLEPGVVGGPCDPIAFASSCFARQERGAIATVFRSGDPRVLVGARVTVGGGGEVFSTQGVAGSLEAELAGAARLSVAEGTTLAFTSRDGAVDALIESIAPPPCLFLFGSGHDAVPVAHLAKSVGLSVIVCDTQSRYITRGRFAAADHLVVCGPEEIASRVDARARAAAVVMAHDYDRDRDALGALLRSRAAYIGVLGPRRRTDRMLCELAQHGVRLREGDAARLHAPVGLDLGAETPAEIALAIVAEVQAALAGAPGSRLRDREGAIHPPANVADRSSALLAAE